MQKARNDMADIELVINITKHEWEYLNKLVENGDQLGHYERLLINGTPLPKRCDIQRIVPKRVDVQKWIYTECPNPNCNHELSTHHGDGYYSIEDEPSFCPKCGQALLWESEE